MQEGLLSEATAFRDANIVDVQTYDELKTAIEAGKWARGRWAGVMECLCLCGLPLILLQLLMS